MEGELFNPFDDEGVRLTADERKNLPAKARAYLERLEIYIAALRESPLTPAMLAKMNWEITRRLEKAAIGRTAAGPWESLPPVSRQRMETVFGLMMDRLHAVAKNAVYPFAEALRPLGYEELKAVIVAALADDKMREMLPAPLAPEVPRAIEPNSVAGVLLDFCAFALGRRLHERYVETHRKIFAEPEGKANERKPARGDGR